MNQHNIFIYSNDDFFERSAGATRVLYYAKALANSNNKVYLTTCCAEAFNDKDFEEVDENIFVHKQKSKVFHNPIKTYNYLKNLYSFAKQKGKATFIHYPSPLVVLETLSLFYLKGLKKQAVFFESNEVRMYSAAFHDPISIKNIKYSLKKIVFKSSFFLMQALLYFYNGHICISTAIEKYGHKFNKNTIRIPILTNPYKELKNSTTKYIKQNAFNIGFSGSIALSKENLTSFIAVIAKIKEAGHNISFNLCGSANPKNKALLDKAILNYNLQDTITYYGNLGEVEFNTFLSQQNLLVIPRGYTKQNKYGFSTKLSDYLNHKKMILITDISDNSLYIKDGINGFIVPPNNEKAMFNKLLYIVENYTHLETKIAAEAYNTAKTDFYYMNYKDKLKSFLIS
ncbi:MULTISPECIES: glycosyltransferase [unclassified Cellulophaga]|uniref:glycosyltransferase n=1 Tax=unclassified Cellulophaga TaxID=2634405 RepID=UPI0026E3C706|nr:MULTISPECIES: glycosyltransferase [unclassified Cellulophaga]MDO6491474.1 glycosyltransferase [Cellulophaga sp. 2_MG-2023]MDO6493351.1 glycosyltransferase [Cellulophaga sp. 3_MG-2023]